MGLCGAADWRIPTIRELISVVNFYSTQGHWVGTGLGIYWSNSTYASISSAAWSIGYVNGATAIMGKNTASKVQLVRTGQ
jgi:hypothetical protein